MQYSLGVFMVDFFFDFAGQRDRFEEFDMLIVKIIAAEQNPVLILCKEGESVLPGRG
jgi:hypothetical protein